MNPSTNETAGLQLPPPVVERPVAGVGSAALNPAERAPEKAPAAAERSGGAPQVAQGVALPIMLPVPPTPDPAATGAWSGAQAADPVAASGAAAAAALDDKDLIEKTWVMKAKQIVAQTHDDPHKQSEELTVFRADYMKKHYDKSLKLSK